MNSANPSTSHRDRAGRGPASSDGGNIREAEDGAVMSCGVSSSRDGIRSKPTVFAVIVTAGCTRPIPKPGPDRSLATRPLLSSASRWTSSASSEAESRQPIAVAQRQVAHVPERPARRRRISRDSRQNAGARLDPGPHRSRNARNWPDTRQRRREPTSDECKVARQGRIMTLRSLTCRAQARLSQEA